MGLNAANARINLSRSAAHDDGRFLAAERQNGFTPECKTTLTAGGARYANFKNMTPLPAMAGQHRERK